MANKKRRTKGQGTNRRTRAQREKRGGKKERREKGRGTRAGRAQKEEPKENEPKEGKGGGHNQTQLHSPSEMGVPLTRVKRKGKKQSPLIPEGRYHGPSTLGATLGQG